MTDIRYYADGHIVNPISEEENKPKKLFVEMATN